MCRDGSPFGEGGLPEGAGLTQQVFSILNSLRLASGRQEKVRIQTQVGETLPGMAARFRPSFSPNIPGLEFSLNLEASDTFIPQNTALLPASLPFPRPHPWPQGHSPFCTPETVISLHHLPVSHRLRVGGPPPGETELTEVAVVPRQGARGRARQPGWPPDWRRLRDRAHAPLGLGHCWAYPSEDRRSSGFHSQS